MISIALATYNGSAYLMEQLESFVRQKRLPDELVASDDASTDNTVAILEDFKGRAPFDVRISRNEKNLGITRNFEKAISICRGDFIFLSDQDDVWLPEKISELADILERDADAGLVFCDAHVADHNLALMGCSFWDSVWFGKRERAMVRGGRAFDVFLRHSVAPAMSMAFRAALREAILPIPDIWSVHDVWTALVISATAGVRMHERLLSKYRVHGESQTVGIHRLSLREQYSIAARQVKDDTFGNLLRLNEELYRRLDEIANSGRYHINKMVMDEIVRKIEHLKYRERIPSNKLMKPGMVFRELINLRYFKYSYGLKSAAQDLFLR